jgi:hypothetical protein
MFTEGVGGCEAGAMAIDALESTVPPGPVQLRVYENVPVLSSGPVDVPLLDSGSAPLQASDPLPPLAVQVVALALIHCSTPA